MRDNSFYPHHPHPGLPRPPMSVTGPFPHFNPTPPRLQGYQRPQNQVRRIIYHISVYLWRRRSHKLPNLCVLVQWPTLHFCSVMRLERMARCWPRRLSQCQETSPLAPILTRGSALASCKAQVSKEDLTCLLKKLQTWKNLRNSQKCSNRNELNLVCIWSSSIKPPFQW